MNKSIRIYTLWAHFTFFIIHFLGLPFEANALLSGGALDGDRPRILLSTDTNRLASASDGGPYEVDDHQSLVRFLLYSDMFDIEGIVHTTAVSKYGLVETVEEILDAYEVDYPNLNSWSSTYPTPNSIRAVIAQGSTWGPRAPSNSRSNAGSQLIVEKANNGDPRPLWILVYGKITDVAQALFDDPSIKNKIRVIGSYQNFTTAGPKQPNDDEKAIEWIQNNHPDLYFIESIETLKATAFNYSGFTYNDSNHFMEENCKDHGALGNHMWIFRKQDKNGNPVSHSGWLRLGDDPTLNYLLNGDFNNPSSDHWGGYFEKANNSVNPNYYKDIANISAAHASGQKFHAEWLDHFAKRLDRARYPNKLLNSDFQKGANDWKFSPGASVAWSTPHTGSGNTKAAKLTLSEKVKPSIEQTFRVSAEKTYTVMGWVRPIAVTGTTIEIWGYWETSGGEIAIRISPDISSGNGSWGYIWNRFTAPHKAKSLKIVISAGLGTGEAYIDDLVVVEADLSPPIGPGTRLLSNGEFTNNIQRWVGIGTTTEWVVGHSGDTTKAAKLTLNPGTYPFISQTINTISEQTYTISAWVKPKEITGTTVKIWAFWQTPYGEIANSVSSNVTSGAGDWFYVWKQLRAPPQATALRVRMGAGRGTGWVYIDDFEVWGP